MPSNARSATLMITTLVLLGTLPARAQLLDSLKGAAGLGQSSAMPAVGSASSGNIAGVLGFCMRNNYLGGSSAPSTESGLMSRLGGGVKHSNAYRAGSQGKLQSSGGGFSLGSAGDNGGLKGKITQKVCEQVLHHAKSLI